MNQENSGETFFAFIFGFWEGAGGRPDALRERRPQSLPLSPDLGKRTSGRAWAEDDGRGRPGTLLSAFQLPAFLSLYKTSIRYYILQREGLQSARVGGRQAPVHSWGFSHVPGGTG